MLLEEIRNIKSSKTDLRKFGLSVGIVLGILGGIFFWRDKSYYQYFLILSSVLIISGLVIPILLKPFQKIWMSLAVIMGWFMTRVILFVLYFACVTPLRVISSLFGKRFLDIQFKNKDSSTKSYWINKPQAKFQKSHYERQF